MIVKPNDASTILLILFYNIDCSPVAVSIVNMERNMNYSSLIKL